MQKFRVLSALLSRETEFSEETIMSIDNVNDFSGAILISSMIFTAFVAEMYTLEASQYDEEYSGEINVRPGVILSQKNCTRTWNTSSGG